MNPRRLTPSMSLLIAFDATARHLSFTRAAAELALTQSAVSRQVQALEGLISFHHFSAYQSQTTPDCNRLCLSSGDQCCVAKGEECVASRDCFGNRARHHRSCQHFPRSPANGCYSALSDFYAKHSGILINLHSRIGQFE